jgi:hypothetical protein
VASDLERGVGALKKFRDRVNDVLSNLEGATGTGSKVANERMTRGSLGVGMQFAEADGFYTQYNRVHKALVSLSKSLNDQIEMYSIAVHAADVGYDNVEEDMRRRFHVIHARLDKQYDDAVDRRKAKDNSGAPEQPRNDNQSADADLG